MIFKKKKGDDYIYEKKCSQPMKKSASKVEALYVSIMCFATRCLSSIVLEVGGRPVLAANKYGTFNSLYRRSSNLKIKIHATNVIAGLLETIMLLLADKYDIPYLYLPWLVNSVKGMSCLEGPALLNLAQSLMTTGGVPEGSFVFTVFLLYLEELIIWNDVFLSFKRCWDDYTNRNKMFSSPSEFTPKSDIDISHEFSTSSEVLYEWTNVRERYGSLNNLSSNCTMNIPQTSTTTNMKIAASGKNYSDNNCRYVDATG